MRHYNELDFEQSLLHVVALSEGWGKDEEVYDIAREVPIDDITNVYWEWR